MYRPVGKFAPVLIFVTFLFVLDCNAQRGCGNNTLEESVKAYNNGNFHKVINLLQPCINSGFNQDQKVQAYRLEAMTYLAMDETDNAVFAVTRLLDIDPNFVTTIFDPVRFVNLVDEQKRPVTSIVTASKQKESIEEVPVPVTVITEEMIRAIGAKNIKEVLLVYVPGMTDITDHNEINISMHGVYGSSQQKILFMINGHRLNSRAYSEANPDFSISLDKIRQIEVLRGPASSLYGNVALTSVINIITKSGVKIKGGELKAGIGNYGQRQFSLLFGNNYDQQTDFVIWANYYQANGEYRFIPKEKDHSPNPKVGEAILGGFNEKPSYDIGLVFKTKNFSILGDLRYCKPIDPFSSGGMTGEVYDYRAYRTLMGVGPGLGSGSGHLDAKYENTFKGNDLMINPYFDYNNVFAGLVINPNVVQFGIVSWNEYSFGGVVQNKRTYDLGGLGKGNIIVGMQYDRMKVYDSFFLLGLNGEFTNMADSSEAKVLDPGTETIYSGFIQMKHRFGKKFLINIGARYDNKDRHMGKNVSNFSPRLSAILIPSTRMDFKLSYAQSFVDAPYWYRYNSLASYKGSENLTPEYLTAIQMTSNFHFFERKLNFEFNLFYNSLKDFIYRDPDATGDDPRYRNAGKLKMTGIETTLRYKHRFYNVYTNFTWMYALEAKDYAVTDHEIHNIPALSGNLVFNINPIYSLFSYSWINITLRYIGKQLSPINTYLNGNDFINPDYYVDETFLVNAGIQIHNFKNISCSVNVNNLLGADYVQGGSVEFPFPMPGRWYMVRLGYRIGM